MPGLESGPFGFPASCNPLPRVWPGGIPPQAPRVSIDGEQGMAARRPLSALSPTSVLRAGEDKGPSGRRIPPVVWAAPPLDKLVLGPRSAR